jgi:hypothetical protein
MYRSYYVWAGLMFAAVFLLPPERAWFSKYWQAMPELEARRY